MCNAAKSRWVEFDERRPVVVLSGDESRGFRAMQVVAPAGVDISGLGSEVAVRAPCTWLTTLSRDDLINQAGVLSSAKLSDMRDARQFGRGGNGPGGAPWCPPLADRVLPVAGSSIVDGTVQTPGPDLTKPGRVARSERLTNRDQPA